MKRRELREHIFQLLFRVEFNGQDEMAEQVSLYVDDMKEEEIVEPKDETYIEENIIRSWRSFRRSTSCWRSIPKAGSCPV